VVANAARRGLGNLDLFSTGAPERDGLTDAPFDPIVRVPAGKLDFQRPQRAVAPLAPPGVGRGQIVVGGAPGLILRGGQRPAVDLDPFDRRVGFVSAFVHGASLIALNES
jgi:hypothetical protein